MFTITDEDRKLRDEGRSWRARCQFNLTQDHLQFVHKQGKNREETILMNSFGAILQERTAIARLMYRENKRPGYVPFVRVIVSQRAVEEAMANTRMKVMNKKNVLKLIHRFVSDDFVVTNLLVDRDGGDLAGNTKRGQRYTEFFLTVNLG